MTDRLSDNNRFERIEQKSIPSMVIQNVLDWNIAHGVDTVPGLNKRVLDGSFPELVREGDAKYHADVTRGRSSPTATGCASSSSPAPPPPGRPPRRSS